MTFTSAYAFPLILFFIHSGLLWIVYKKTRSFHDRNYLNSKQKFILHSGRLSFTVYIIQAINFVKTFLTGILSIYSDNKYANIIIIVLYYLFDLYPFVFLFHYWKYLGRSKGEKVNNESLLTLD